MRERQISPDPSLCAIGDFSRQFGASFRTIRYYEEIGLLKPVRVKQSRFFSERDYSRMRFIELTKAMGLTLTEIRDLLETLDEASSPRNIRIPLDLLQERVGMLEQQRADLDRKLQRLRAAQRGLGVDTDPGSTKAEGTR